MELSQEAIYKLFLEDLDALHRFEGDRAALGLTRPPSDDPDVERLLEALAFFSARTRASAATATYSAVARMAAGTLDYLFDPMPAAAMIRADATGRVPEAMELRRGTVFRLQYSDGAPSSAPSLPGGGSHGVAGFLSATTSTPVLPVHLEHAALQEVRRKLALELTLSATVPQRTPRELVFHVRRLGNYRSSLELQVALEQHVRRATAGVTGGAQEVVCQVSFGQPAPATARDEGDPRNPFERIRSFFHFPEQDLFLRVLVPALAKPWTKLTVQLELDDTWPEDLTVSAEMLLTSVVPAVNLWSDLAAPLVYDGTKDLHRIIGRTVVDELEPINVRGVYRADAGMSPLLPFTLGSRDEGWELVRSLDDSTPMLRVRVPAAFSKPAKLSIDAVWSQPSLWRRVTGQPRISLQTQRLQGVNYGLVGAVRRPQPSPLAANPSRGLDLLALRAQRDLDLHAISGMLKILGASGDSAYRGCPALIESIQVRDVAAPGAGGSDLLRVYDVALSQPSADDAPLLLRFGERIRDLIEAWSEGLVEVDVTTHRTVGQRGGGR
ncbi:type VI secretion system baseplate subunit TssF [Myxococcota bacterium]|nr:type VI secretion system baseplate subunit TssF [Myxococcota bacterium]